MIELSRRKFLTGVVIAAPAVVTFSSLMPVKLIDPWYTEIVWRDETWIKTYMAADRLRPLSWFIDRVKPGGTMIWDSNSWRSRPVLSISNLYKMEERHDLLIEHYADHKMRI